MALTVNTSIVEHSRIPKDHTPENMASLRRVALNRVRRERLPMRQIFWIVCIGLSIYTCGGSGYKIKESESQEKSESMKPSLTEQEGIIVLNDIEKRLSLK